MANNKKAGQFAEKQQQGTLNKQREREGTSIGNTKAEEYKQIAAAVAIILKPMIQETIEAAMQAGLDKMRKDMESHDARIGEIEERMLNVEDEQTYYQVRIQTLETNINILADKVDDLENRSRRSNIRIVGIQETVKMAELNRICTLDIPRALGIDKECIVERSHRLGAVQADRQGPRQVITKYLNYSNKTAILQKFRANRELQKGGQDLLIFADYSPDLSKRRKNFSKVCTQLYQRQIKLSLAYLATLYISLQDGGQRIFYDHNKAESYISNLKNEENSDTPNGKRRGTPVQPTKIICRLLATPQPHGRTHNK